MKMKNRAALFCFGVLTFWIYAVAEGEITSEVDALQLSGNNRPVIGVYYYPWYQKSEKGRDPWKRVFRQRLKNPQQPKAGLYQSNDPAVIGEHISQSVRGGISFWAVSWWGKRGYGNDVFRNGILKHPDADKLKYAILYESTGRLGSLRNPDLAIG